MTYTFDLSNCTDPHLLHQTVPSSLLTPEDAAASGYTASPSGWTRLDPTTAAIITSCSHVQLPIINRSTLSEWIYRLNSLFDAGVSFSAIQTSEGPVPVRIYPANLLRHLNLTFSCPHLSDHDFDALLRLCRKSTILTPAPSHIPTFNNRPIRPPTSL